MGDNNYKHLSSSSWCQELFGVLGSQRAFAVGTVTMPNLQMRTVRPAELGVLLEVPWGRGISQDLTGDLTEIVTPAPGPRVLHEPCLLHAPWCTQVEGDK